MPEIAINRIEYTAGDKGPIIHVLGRDADGIARHVEVEGFRPYFYATKESMRGRNLPANAHADLKTEYRSIRGDTCHRIYTTNPGEVRDLRDRFTHLEADVVFTVRFQIDTGIRSGMSYPSEKCKVSEIAPADLNYPSRVCTIDIECSDENGWPDARSDPITCVTCYDSFTKEYTTFVLGDSDRRMPAPDHCTTIVFQKEKDLLKELISYITDTDPDILTGWNVNDFDIPYIMGRLEANHLSKDSIARLPGTSLHDDTIRGRQVFDLLSGYKRMHLTKKDSYRLDAIAEAEIGEHKVHFSGKICELPLETLVEYNRKDVELCVRIDAKDEIVDFHREIAKYVGCSLDRTLQSMPLIDVYILRKAQGKFVLPSKGGFKD
ncbi:MAG: 3'-5' exonuclease, partial [Candidatus Paceibacterota bacterium]